MTARVGRFAQTLPRLLDEAAVDYAYIDGNHREDATVEHFKRISAVAAPGALLVFDDVIWSPRMARAWKRIRNSPRVAE